MNKPTRPPILKVQSVYKHFQSGADKIEVLKGIDLELYAGEFLSVIGESGCGKSTLLHVLGTLEPADSGSAVLDGTSLFALSQREMSTTRNLSIGFVYQAHHLIPELDARENVALPLMVRGVNRSQTLLMAEAMLTRLGLGHRLSHRPARLSGGEAQRVAVARAMVGKPKLLLADEPTGNLDERTAMDVFSAIQQLCLEDGVSTMMVTHSLTLARRCDRILRLHSGRLYKQTETFDKTNSSANFDK